MASVLALGGCFAPYGERVEPVPIAQDRMLGPDAAFVAPPVGGPSVIGVIQRTYRNAVRQSIILATDGSVAGENTFEVTFYGPLKAPPDAGNLKRDTGTLTEIAAEMRREIPLPMAISPNYAQNSYGPFGFAFGGTSAGRCLYAWQRIHAQRNIFQEPSARGEISLRLRLCRRGATDAELLAVMYGFAFVATLPNPNWNPFGTPPPADPTIGRRGTAINPLAHEAATAAPSAAPAPAAASPARTSNQRTVRRTEPDPAAAARVGRPPDRLPTPVADPALVRQTATGAGPTELGMPPALSDASPAAAPAGPAATAVPPAPGAGQPVRQVGPGTSPGTAPPATAAPTSGTVPPAPRVTP